eukprot:1688661-Amphidinium_carterae.1
MARKWLVQGKLVLLPMVNPFLIMCVGPFISMGPQAKASNLVLGLFGTVQRVVVGWQGECGCFP